MRTLEELRCALVVNEMHVQQQAEQLATLTRDVDSLDKEGHLPCSLTARVATLEARAREADELRKTLADMAAANRPETAPQDRSRESQASISKWANDTFGPSGSNARVAARANEEMAELLRALTARVAALEASEAERAIDRMVARRTGPGRPMVSAGKVQTPAKLDEAPLGVGAKVLIPGEVVAVDTDGSLRVRYSAMGSDAYHAWCRAEQVRPEPAAPPPPANTSLTCVLCRSVEPQEGRVHTIRRHGKGHTSCDCAPAAPPPPAAPDPASDDYEARARHHLETLLRVPGGLEPYEGDVMDLAALLRGVADEAAAKAVGKARREEQAACEAVCREVAEECRPHSQIKTHVATVCADRIAARGKDESPRTGQADG